MAIYLLFGHSVRQHLGSVTARSYNFLDAPRVHHNPATVTKTNIDDVNNVKIHIGFLKVHKTASTTTQSIFLRFGWRRNLTFVLPPEYNKNGYPNVISTVDPPNEKNVLPPPIGKAFDILCHHVIYSKSEWDKFLPPGYALIGSVREPWKQFMSMLNYMKPGYVVGIKENDFVRAFLQNPHKYEPKNIRRSLTNNRMSFEFGVHPDIIYNRDIPAFKKYLEQLDNDFGVVIVAERFDESLVLMKRYLQWSLEDILYVSQHVYTQNYSLTFEPTLEDQINFENFSVFDRLLYNFFSQKLDNQIIAEGPSFANEVKHFQAIREYVENVCHRKPRVPVNGNPAIQISRTDCALLKKPELRFTQDIRRIQYGSATWTWLNRNPP